VLICVQPRANAAVAVKCDDKLTRGGRCDFTRVGRQLSDMCRPRTSLAIGIPLLVSGLGVLTLAAGAWAVPGHPGEPQPPKVVYVEDFEHEMGRKPVLLTHYTGAPPLGITYTADQRYLENCNGFIVEFDSNERVQATDCAEVAFNRVRQMAWVLGKLRGLADPRTNNAVSAYTDGGKVLPANAVQFETVKPIPLVKSNRFITFSVDAGETNCTHAHAEFKFYLLNGSTEIPTFTSPIDPCTDKNAKVIEPPELGTKPAEPFKAGTFAGNSATLFSGSELGIRMRNGQTSENGNDAAFDNIQVLDATPQLDKSFSPEVLNVGETSELTFTITNTSELAAKDGWSFTDTLPDGLVMTTPARASTTCPGTTVTAAAGGSSIAVHGNLAAEMNYCTVTVDVTSATEGVYTNGPNDVTETGLEPPGEATVKFGLNADLAIEKSASPSPGVPGSDVTYTLKVTNKGPDTAQDAVVTDPLPDGLTFVSGSPQCSASTPGEVKCTLGSLAVGDSVTLTIVAHIADSVTAGFVNTATVSSSTPDPDLSNNSASASTPISLEADLEIQKIASLATVTAGGQVSYTLIVSNNGPNDATDVTVTDPLPEQLRAISVQPSQGMCTIGDGVVCNLGAIANGGSAQILITASVASSASGSLTNTATVTGGQTDPSPDNNSSSATIDVTPLAPQPLDPGPNPLTPLADPAQPISDMQIVKHVNRAVASVGQKLKYTLNVTNRGPDDAPDVRVTDTWSLGLRILSARASQGSCRIGRSLECVLGTVNQGAAAKVTVVALVERAGSERNTAKVTSANRDPDLSNNQSSVLTGVTARRKRTPPKAPPKVTG
jgi:uncharacterized repeat protein (TIGR01451 family)